MRSKLRAPDTSVWCQGRGQERFPPPGWSSLLCWFLLLTSAASVSPLPVRPHRDTTKAGSPILVGTAALPGEPLKCWTKNLCPKSHIPDHAEQVLLQPPSNTDNWSCRIRSDSFFSSLPVLCCQQLKLCSPLAAWASPWKGNPLPFPCTDQQTTT